MNLNPVNDLLSKIKEFDEWCSQRGFTRSNVLEFNVNSDTYNTELSVSVTNFEGEEA